jgi:O-antigen/teichoic acid export membrane protein
LQKFRKIFITQLFQVSWLNTVSVIVRITGGLVAGKIVALFIGPQGLAITGNFRNFLSGIDIISTLGFQNGIVKYIAEHDKDSGELKKILATIFISILIIILVMIIILLSLAGIFNNLIFPGQDYSWIFQVLAYSLPLYTGNFILISVLNGLGNYRYVININILGNISGVGISALLIWKMGISGALLGLIASPVIIFIISSYIFYSRFGVAFLKWKYFSRNYFSGLLSFSAMSIFAALFTPVVYISIRNKIALQVGEIAAGYWEGVNRISVFYMIFIFTLLTVYYLPKLSAAKSESEIKSLFAGYYRYVVPMFTFGLILVYIFREIIIKIALSDAFMPMKDLFFWQLTGDFLKVCGLVLAFELIAKKAIKAFLIFEAFSFAFLYAASTFFIPEFGAEGAVMAHTLNYAILLILFLVYFRRKLFA